MYKMMTPGPTQVRENVRMARSLEFQNPDLDADFCEYYKETCLLASELLHTKNETLILDGEESSVLKLPVLLSPNQVTVSLSLIMDFTVNLLKIS